MEEEEVENDNYLVMNSDVVMQMINSSEKPNQTIEELKNNLFMLKRLEDRPEADIRRNARTVIKKLETRLLYQQDMVLPIDTLFINYLERPNQTKDELTISKQRINKLLENRGNLTARERKVLEETKNRLNARGGEFSTLTRDAIGLIITNTLRPSQSQQELTASLQTLERIMAERGNDPAIYSNAIDAINKLKRRRR